MVQNCFLRNIVRYSLLGTEFGFPEGLTVLKDLYDGKDRSDCELSVNEQRLLMELIPMTQNMNHLHVLCIRQRRHQRPDKSP